MRYLLFTLLLVFTHLSALKVAIISALPGEVGGLTEQMVEEKSAGGRSFYTGELHGVNSVITHCWTSRVGAGLYAEGIVHELFPLLQAASAG